MQKEYITEITRGQFISKSKKGHNYKDDQAENRWVAKNQCQIANKVVDYNKIDMDTFWKKNSLNFKIAVKGKTNNYVVTVEILNALQKIQLKIKANKNKFDANIVYSALSETLNSNDIKIGCSCPDYHYRFQYWATKDNYNALQSENIPANETNPENNLGAGCKHVLAVLNNLEWLHKIASVIVNYANYCKENMEYNYGKFIFPKLFGIPYEEAIQMTIEDFDDNGNLKDKLESSEEIINLSNAIGKERGKFKKGSNKNPAISK